MKGTLLIIDDNQRFAASFAALGANDYEVNTAHSGEEGLVKFATLLPDVLVLDLKLGRGIDGLEVLRRLRDQGSDVPVIMMTDYASVDTAFEAGRLGACFYTSKVPDLNQLYLLIEQQLEKLVWKRGYDQERQRRVPQFIGESAAVKQIWQQVEKTAPIDVPVLITGETGTGKELIAHAIHARSRRSAYPLFTLNCSNLGPELLESQFFGHERGSFTGAYARQIGQFEAADKSTLFMDEVGDLPVESQAKILRAIENKTFQRIGSTVTLHSDVRIIAATHQNLEDAMGRGRFRKDLFYRLTPVVLSVPPLRQRREDIPLLVSHFVQKYAMEFHRPLPSVPGAVMEYLQNYDWPGNVRQLQNALQTAVIYSEEQTICLKNLPMSIAVGKNAAVTIDDLRHLSYAEAKHQLLDRFQRDYIYQALVRCDWNITRAAEETGIHRATIHKIINEAGWKGAGGDEKNGEGVGGNGLEG